MVPALPVANLIAENMTALVPLLQQHMELSHNLRLASMLKEIASDTTRSVTERQLDAILTLTKQSHDSLDATLQHYRAEQAKYNDVARADTTKLKGRLDAQREGRNIDAQIKRLSRQVEGLQRFSGELIARCGEMGLHFVHDVACRIK